jgi:alkylresorcinol/alkylpyrone synthase
LGIGTAVPGQRYDQGQLLTQLQPYFLANRHTETIFQNAGVGYRYLATGMDFYQEERSTQARNEVYMRTAQELGAQAIQRCLLAAKASPTDVDDFVVVSCTGIDTPGLDLLLAGALGMRSNLRRSSILGMGCYAALPGLSRARDAVVAQSGRKTLVLAVEICSLHFQPDDPSTENLVSSALFADGAAAVLIGGDSPASGSVVYPGPCLLDFATFSDYQTLDRMAFHLTDHGFHMHLSAYVPSILAAKVEEFVDELLGRSHLRREDVQVWGVHPGSAKILEHTQQRLQLPDHALDASFAVLHDYGNMSSPTILFILECLQREGRAKPGDFGVLLAFGPGLTIEGALLQW